MNHVNKYLRNFKPYQLASHAIWNASPEERKDILKLDWNESGIGPTPKVKERLLELINEADFFNLYPSTNNTKLYGLLSKYTSLPVENIQYFGSSDSLHEYICKLFISVGDPVAILWPSYDNFRLTVEINGGKIFYFDYGEDFSFDEKAFVDFIRNVNPSLVYICNPNNPIGCLHSVSFIEPLLKEFPEAMFLVDEAYYEFTNPKTTCAQLVTKYENLLVSRTMSKAFCLANFRFGYLLASKNNIQYISTIRNSKNITTFAQEAATMALEDVEYMENYVAEVNKAKRMFIDNVRKSLPIDIFDSEANFVLLRFRDYDEKKNVFEYLKSKLIFVRSTEQSQSVRNCLRISIGTCEQMDRVYKALEGFYGR